MDANGAYDVDSCVTDADAELMLMLKMENWQGTEFLKREMMKQSVTARSGVPCCGNGWPSLLPVTDWLFLDQPPVPYLQSHPYEP